MLFTLFCFAAAIYAQGENGLTGTGSESNLSVKVFSTAVAIMTTLGVIFVSCVLEKRKRRKAVEKEVIKALVEEREKLTSNPNAKMCDHCGKICEHCCSKNQ